MAALTDDAERNRKEGVMVSYPVSASEVIYKGALVCDNGSGYAIACADNSSYHFVGVAVEQTDNSSGSAGDDNVRVYKTGVFEIPKSSATQTDVGTVMYARSDNEVASSTTNSVTAGYVVDLVDSSTVALRIDRAVQ